MMNDQQSYNLRELYGSETPLQKYKRLTVGENASLLNLLVSELILTLCTGRFGMIGIGMRRLLYPLFFKGFNAQSTIGRNVMLRCPRHISLGRNVIIDDCVQLIATSKKDKAITINEGTFIRSFAMLNAGPPEGFIHIGTNCSVGQGAILYGNGGVTIGSDVMIAGQSFIVASHHIFSDNSKPMSTQGFSASGITINDNVWIGAGAKILDGVTIGEGAIIGANAVVNSDVAPGQKVAGIPARPIS